MRKLWIPAIGFSLVGLLVATEDVAGVPSVAAGALIDYRPLAFQQKTWDEKKTSTLLRLGPERTSCS